MNVEQVSAQKTVKVTIILVVASNICSHSSYTYGPADTPTATQHSFHIRTGIAQEHRDTSTGTGWETTGPSGDPLRLLSRRRSKHNTLYRHLEWSYGTTWLFVPPHPSLTAAAKPAFLIIYRPWCMRFIWKPCPHKLCTTLSPSSIPQVFFCFRHRPTLSCKHTPSWEKGALV